MKQEKFFICFVALVAIVLINLPITYFYLVKNDGRVFLGRSLVDLEDTYTYVSNIEQVRQGQQAVRNLYTSEPQSPALPTASDVIIGRIAARVGLSSIAAYHLARIVLSVFFLMAAYGLITKFFNEPGERIAAFTILVSSSGLGFMLGGLYPNSSDIGMPGSLTFMTLGGAPHFILAQTLMMAGFIFLIEFVEKKHTWSIVLASLIWLVLSFEFPQGLIIVFPAILMATLWVGFRPINSFILAGSSVVGLVFRAIGTTLSWQLTSPSLSPSVAEFLIGYGLLIPLTVVGIERFIGEKRLKNRLILSWIFVEALMVYSPFAFQRLLIEGFHIPLSILAAEGVITVYTSLKRYKKELVIGLVGILSLGSIGFIFNNFNVISAGESQISYFIDKDELAAIDQLGRQTTLNDVVLANLDYGNLIPGLIGRRVYLGHSTLTQALNTKIGLANAFLLNSNPLQSLSFLGLNKITYVFLGKNDPMTVYGFQPEKKSFLKPVYLKNGVKIYKVDQSVLRFGKNFGSSGRVSVTWGGK